MTVPLREFDETQTWRRDDLEIAAGWREGVLYAWIATVDRDGAIARDPKEEAWAEAAAREVAGVGREWGPAWNVTEEAFPAFVAALQARMSTRTLRAARWDDRLAPLLAGTWSVMLYWSPAHEPIVQVDVRHDGTVMLTGADPHLDDLRALTAEDLQAPNPAWYRATTVPAERSAAFVRALARWRPHALALCHLTVFNTG